MIMTGDVYSAAYQDSKLPRRSLMLSNELDPIFTCVFSIHA